MTPREYIETAMSLAVRFALRQADAREIGGAAEFDVAKQSHDELESHLRENLDALLEAAYDKGLEDRDEG
jgi:hypothetical protein